MNKSVVPVIGVFFEEVDFVVDWLECVLAQSNDEYEVIPVIIANLSSEKSFALSRRIAEFRTSIDSRFEFRQLDTNKGHSHAFNQGLLHCAAKFPGVKWIGSLDPDARLCHGAVAEMIRVGDMTENCGMVAPVTLKVAKNAMALSKKWRNPLEENETILHVGHYPVNAPVKDDIRLHWKSHEMNQDFNKDLPVNKQVFAPCFCASIWSTRMIEKVGLVDEGQFRTLNCAEFGYRGRLHGYSCAAAIKAIAFHPQDCIKFWRTSEFEACNKGDSPWHFQHGQGLIALKYFPKSVRECCRQLDGQDIPWTELISELMNVTRYQSTIDLDEKFEEFIEQFKDG